MKKPDPYQKKSGNDASSIKALVLVVLLASAGIYLLSLNAHSDIVVGTAIMSFSIITMGYYSWTDYQKGLFKWYLDGLVAAVVVLICFVICFDLFFGQHRR